MRHKVPVALALALLAGAFVLSRTRPTAAGADRAADSGRGGSSVSTVQPAAGGAETVSSGSGAGRREAARGLLRGVVRADGLGLADVELVLTPSGGGEPLAARTGADGVWELSALEPGAWSLSVDPGEPFLPFQRTVAVREGETVADVDLVARFRLRVRAVRDAPAAGAVEPVAGARIALVPVSGVGALEIAAVSGPNGEAELADLAAGRYALEVTADGHVPFERVLQLDAGQFARDAHLRGRKLIVRLQEPGLRLYGVIRDAGGEPVAGALVCLDQRVPQDASARMRAPRTARDADRSAPPHTVTGADGAFELAAPAGAGGTSLLVCAARPGAPLIYRHPLPHGVAPDREVRVRLPGSVRLEVRCTGAGGTLTDGTVELSDGLVTHDLTIDPVLARIPGVARWNLLERSPGRVVLDVLPGGYRVLHTPADGVAGREAFFVAVEGPDPQFASFTLGDG